MTELKIREANLACYPTKVVAPKEDFSKKSITIGDLHGNSIKLIYFLIREGVMILHEQHDYQLLCAIYQTPIHYLQADQLKKFEQILQNSTLNHPGLIRLLGDEIFDRGNNDYFTFLVLNKLKENHINLEIMLSNHGSVGVQRILEGHNGLQVIGNALYNQQQSGDYFWQLMEAQRIDVKAMLKAVGQHYLPLLKLIGYHLTTHDNLAETITRHPEHSEGSPVMRHRVNSWRSLATLGMTTLHLFTHAPIGLETIQDIAKFFNVDYDDTSAAQLIKTIDNINKQFQCLIQTNTFPTYYNVEHYDDTHPICALLWTRTLRQDFTLTPGGPFSVTLTHGHVGPDWQPNFPADLSSPPVLTNLDNLLGKSPTILTGTYPVLVD